METRSRPTTSKKQNTQSTKKAMKAGSSTTAQRPAQKQSLRLPAKPLLAKPLPAPGWLRIGPQVEVPTKKLVPDDRGRVTLGEIAKLVSSYTASFSPDGTITLVPMVEIPAREQWLWNNQEAMAMVRRGLADSARGSTVPLDSSLLADDGDD